MILSKYHGLGNDYFVYDCNKNEEKLTTQQVKWLCHRNCGLGSDGILVGPFLSESGNYKVQILNPDGSEAEKSGNGVRIFSKYLKDAGYIKENEFELDTLGGTVKVKYLNEEGTNIQVSMGQLSFDSEIVGVTGSKRQVVDEPMVFGGKEYKCTCVSIGNPHCIMFFDDISKDLVCEIGEYSEAAFCFPNRINTQIVKVINRNLIDIEIFERGAGYTLSSGSSSCAAAGAAHKLGYVDDDVTVHMPGGNLKIHIDKENNVIMSGEVVYIGNIVLTR